MGLALPEIRAAVRTGDTPPAERRGHAEARAAHPGHHARVALPHADRGEEPRACSRSARTRDRRRDPRARARQARLAPGAVARAARRARRHAAGAHRPLRHAAADRDDRAPSWSAERGARRARSSTSATSATSTSRSRCRRARTSRRSPRRSSGTTSIELLAALHREHRTTLVFVNTRRLAERLAHRLGERLGEEHVAAHHGSLSRERRLRVEAAAEGGRAARARRDRVARARHRHRRRSSSCARSARRARSRRSCSAIGRSGHALGLRPKGRLFPTSRDELVECAALVRAVRARASRPHRDSRRAARHPRAADRRRAARPRSGTRTRSSRSCARAWPYRELDARGVRRRARDAGGGHRDAEGGAARGCTAIGSTAGCAAGAARASRRSPRAARSPRSPTTRSCSIPTRRSVGTRERGLGDREHGGRRLPARHAQLAHPPRRVGRGARGRRAGRAADDPVLARRGAGAHARSSRARSRRCAPRSRARSRAARDAAVAWLARECGLDEAGATQIARYVEAQKTALGFVPTRDDLLAERFFDEAGGMQLVVHAPFGGRVNRAFGLALRKRFCASFDFELQAAATDDAIVLSLGARRRFPLDDCCRRFLHASTCARGARAGAARLADVRRALALERRRARSPCCARAARAACRSRSSACRPTTCSRRCSPSRPPARRTSTDPIEIPDHPLVAPDACATACTRRWTCDGLEALLERLEAGEVRMHCARHGRAVAVQPRDPERAAVRVPRRRAARGAAHARGVAAPRAARGRARPRGARRRGDRARARGGRARARATPTSCTSCSATWSSRGRERSAVRRGRVEALVADGRAARRARAGRRAACSRARSCAELRALFPDVRARAAARAAGRARRARVRLRDRARRGGARTPRAARAGDRARSSRRAIGVAARAVESALARLEGRGIAVRGRFERRARGRAVLRPQPARAHPPLHAGAAAARDRAGQRAGLPALPARLAAPRARARGCAGEGGLLAVARAALGLRGRRGGLGGRAAAGARRRLQARAARRAVPLGRGGLGADLAGAGGSPGTQPSRLTPIGVFPRADLEALLQLLAARARGEPQALRGPRGAGARGPARARRALRRASSRPRAGSCRCRSRRGCAS